MVSIVEAAGEEIIKNIEEARKKILDGTDIDEVFDKLAAEVYKIIRDFKIIRDLDGEFRWILNLFW